MSGFAHDVATASLPVAIALALLAATARLVLWAQVDDEWAQRIARQYLEPLTTWCLVAVAVNSLAVGAAGDAGLLSLALPAGLGAAAVLLRPAGEASDSSRAAPQTSAPSEPPPISTPAQTATPSQPAPAGSLWAGAADESSPRTGLWSR